MSNRRQAAFAAALIFASSMLAGCIRNAICGSDDYPVVQVGGTGRQCVPADQEPPAGWARFPSGQVPEHVDDEWDVYWRTHTIDSSGATVEVSRPG